MPVMVPATGVPVDVLVEGDSNGWLGADLVSTADGQAVALTASSNPHGRPRSGIVTVEGLSGERVSFSVTQWGWCESGGGDCDGDGISDACAIAQEERGTHRLVIGTAGRQKARMPLARIQGAFELEVAQQPTFNHSVT